MKKRMGVILSLLFATITTCALASCGRSKWEYSKKDASEFIELNAKVSKNDSEKYEMDITSENPVFKNIVYKDNILLFDLSKVNNVKGYMKYEDVKDFYEFTRNDVRLDNYVTGPQIQDIPIAI